MDNHFVCIVCLARIDIVVVVVVVAFDIAAVAVVVVNTFAVDTAAASGDIVAFHNHGQLTFFLRFVVWL